MKQVKYIFIVYYISKFYFLPYIDRNQKEGRWVMIPEVGKSITSYYDLDFYEKFLKSDFV